MHKNSLMWTVSCVLYFCTDVYPNSDYYDGSTSTCTVFDFTETSGWNYEFVTVSFIFLKSKQIMSSLCQCMDCMPIFFYCKSASFTYGWQVIFDLGKINLKDKTKQISNVPWHYWHLRESLLQPLTLSAVKTPSAEEDREMWLSAFWHGNLPQLNTSTQIQYF